MKTTYVSSQAISNTLRRSVLDIQKELTQSQQELSSGRVADVGLSLGSRTGQDVTLRNQQATLQTVLDANSIADSRLSSTQSALDALSQTAGGFLDSLVQANGSQSNASVVAQDAKTRLGDLISTGNTYYNGEYVFGGINTDTAPMTDYFGPPPSAAKQAVDAAFQARFGMTQDDPAVSTISAADMQDFLDNDFAALFDDANWSTNWSSASDEAVRSQISSSEQVTTGASANDQSVRKLAMAFTMVADLGTAGLSAGAYQAVMSKATGLIGEAQQSITTSQSQLGSSQEAVKNAGDRISAQMDVIATHIGKLENVDPYETATRVNDLTTQLETAYAVTGRLQQLSLLDYL